MLYLCDINTLSFVAQQCKLKLQSCFYSDMISCVFKEQFIPSLNVEILVGAVWHKPYVENLAEKMAFEMVLHQIQG